MQEARLRNTVADKTSGQFIPDRSSFPQEGLDSLRQQRLLGAQIPLAFGGDGALVSDVTHMCTLGRACASTAMIFAMHQTKVACLVRHGAGNNCLENLMRPAAAEQMLETSSEGQNGANMRFSAAAVVHAGSEISLVRNA